MAYQWCPNGYTKCVPLSTLCIYRTVMTRKTDYFSRYSKVMTNQISFYHFLYRNSKSLVYIIPKFRVEIHQALLSPFSLLMSLELEILDNYNHSWLSCVVVSIGVFLSYFVRFRTMEFVSHGTIAYIDRVQLNHQT